MFATDNICYDDNEIPPPEGSDAGTSHINLEVSEERRYYNELVITRNRVSFSFFPYKK